MSTNETDQACTDECPELRAAAEVLRQAQDEVCKAKEFYEDVRRRAAQKVETVRNTTVGQVFDCTLEQVKKHPGPGLFIAAAAGFFLGRLLKR